MEVVALRLETAVAHHHLPQKPERPHGDVPLTRLPTDAYVPIALGGGRGLRR